MNPVDIEVAQFRQIQETKWSFFYVLNVAVANGTTFPAVLTVDDDADFLIESFTGSCYGPCSDDAGTRALNASTIFPLAGTVVPSGAGLGAYADRGLMMKIRESGGKGRTLTSGFVPVETILSPGYGISKTVEQPFKMFMSRNSSLAIDIRNRDTTASLFHFLSLTVYGKKLQSSR